MTGSERPGPSDEYMALLRGEITSEEYVAIVKRQIREKLPYRKPRTTQEAVYRMHAAMSNLGDDLLASLPRSIRKLLGR